MQNLISNANYAVNISPQLLVLLLRKRAPVMRNGLHANFEKKVQQDSQTVRMKCTGKADRKANKQGYASNERDIF